MLLLCNICIQSLVKSNINKSKLHFGHSTPLRFISTMHCPNFLLISYYISIKYMYDSHVQPQKPTFYL